MSKELRIVFMGTPEFAVPSLEILIEHGFNVVAIVTAPDRPQGRGQKVTPSPVKECALKYQLPVLQPLNLKSTDFIEELKGYHANLQIVVAFRMLPELVWSMPEFGTFNLHASLLPQYRGAAPINWAIINGETETGVTTFFLKHDIDTGNIIFQDREPIRPEDNAGTLYDRLMKKGAELVLKTVKAIAEETIETTPQVVSDKIHHAPKIYKETCEINWHQPTKRVIDFVRGLSPYPAAWTTINNKSYKIYKANSVTAESPSQSPFITDEKTYLYFKTDGGWVSIEELQPEGKKKMNIGVFFRGNKL